MSRKLLLPVLFSGGNKIAVIEILKCYVTSKQLDVQIKRGIIAVISSIFVKQSIR